MKNKNPGSTYVYLRNALAVSLLLVEVAVSSHDGGHSTLVGESEGGGRVGALEGAKGSSVGWTSLLKRKVKAR